MIKKTNKIIALLLAAVLSFSAYPFTAFAGSIGSISSDTSVGADDAQNAKTAYFENQISAESISTGVYLTIDDSDIVVSAPTAVIINGTPDKNGNYTGSYTVSASGDISADKLVQIKPNDKGIELNQKGKLSKAAEINQDKTLFDNEDLQNNIKTSGKVTANGLTAGSWSASTSFELKIISKSDYDAIPNAQLLAENKDVKTYEDYDLFELGKANISKNEYTPTKDGDKIISAKMLYLPYGSAVKFDTNKLTELGYKANPDIRLYQYSADGEYIGQITSAKLAPSEDNADNDFNVRNFVVTEKEGIYVRVVWVKWQNTFTENTGKDLKSAFKVHNLTKINAEVFDNSTLTKCWDNEATYEAWPSKCMFFNPNDNLYYAFYASQTKHAEYDGEIMYRTSSDLVNWSNSTVVWGDNTDNYAASMNGATLCKNGDILISMLCGSGTNISTSTRYLRSSDNGSTWTTEDFILDGINVTNTYRANREKILNDGRIFSCYFDRAHKEKVGICYSQDNGHTWKSSNFSSKYSLSDNGEYDFELLNNGNILCIERTPSGICASISTDNGKSFINETPLAIDVNNQFINCPIIRYDKENDRLTIYEVDRFATGALVGIYTSGNNITDFLLNRSEFKGFQANVCALGINGNADMGYPHIIDAPDGTVKCFYYNRINGEADTASWYSVSTN